MNLHWSDDWQAVVINYQTPRRVSRHWRWHQGHGQSIVPIEHAEDSVRHLGMDRRHVGRAIRKIRRLQKLLVPVVRDGR